MTEKTLETLKDIEVKIDTITRANDLAKKIPTMKGITGKVIFCDDVKNLAIKWVKEDLKNKSSIKDKCRCIPKWMERLNISEEDLK